MLRDGATMERWATSVDPSDNRPPSPLGRRPLPHPWDATRRWPRVTYLRHFLGLPSGWDKAPIHSILRCSSSSRMVMVENLDVDGGQNLAVGCILDSADVVHTVVHGYKAPQIQI